MMISGSICSSIVIRVVAIAALHHDIIQRDIAPGVLLFAPHAGYVYSGRVAGRAFAKLRANAQTITRVVSFRTSPSMPWKWNCRSCRPSCHPSRWCRSLSVMRLRSEVAQPPRQNLPAGGPEALIVVSSDSSHYQELRDCAASGFNPDSPKNRTRGMGQLGTS